MIYLVKEKYTMTDSEKFNNLEDLRERVVDLPESERRKQKTANEIQEALLGLVNKKNKRANAYEKNFKRRVEGKKAKRDSRQEKREIKIKYGSTNPDIKTAEKHKEWYTKQDYKKILEEIKWNHKTEEEIKNEIFSIIKRAFNKNITIHKWSDIDKDASLFLLKITGFFKDKNGEKIELQKAIEEVPQWEIGKKWLNIDTGWTINGIKVNNVIKKTPEGKIKNKSLLQSQVIVSEHSDLSPEARKAERPTSSAHMVYYMLDQLEQIPSKHKEQLQRFINFVDIVDSLDYQASGMDYTNNYRTLFGLYRNLKIENIYQYFEDPRNTGFEILSEEFLTKNNVEKRYRKNNEMTTETVSLKKISEQQKERTKKNIDQFNEIEKKWQFGKFNNERFIIALGNEVGDGSQVAAYNESWLLKIFPSGDFYMFSPRLLPKKILDFDTDDHFLTIRNISKENLEKLLEIFEFNPKETKGIKEKVLAYRESIRTIEKKEREIGDNKKLKDIPVNQLKEGQTYTGIVNNVNGKNIYVYITPTIIWLIKGETREKELSGGEKINIKIKSIVQSENNKTLISLEKVD